MDSLNITYYLGAGSSAQAIPIVKDFAKEMIGIQTFLNYHVNLWMGTENVNHLGILENGNSEHRLFNDLKALQSVLYNHVSFDTYARVQYLRNNYAELKKLKYLLSLYLTLLQIVRKTDERYESFFASISEQDGNKIRLPKTVNYISWNYDMQIEKAIAELLGNSMHHGVYQILNVFPSMGYKKKEENPHLVKLNGTASYHYVIDIKRDLIEFLFEKRSKKGIEEMLNYYDQISEKPNFNVPFGFAWESEDEDVKEARQKAKEIISETEILVSIGYSFPVFNRRIDRELLSAAKKLSKIYLQDPDPSGSLIRLQSLLNRKVEIIPISEIDQFYIPFELV